MNETESSGPAGGLSRLAEALSRQADESRRATDLILPLLERIALALERAPAPVATPGPPPAAGFRRLVEARDWDRAEEVALNHPDDPEVAGVVAGLADRVEAARQVNDPDGAIAARDDLARVLHGEAIREVDRSLAKWLIAAIHRKLRAGTIRPEVAELAARVADRFGGTAEGASLRAALPTLRRSAGLCPRCGEPYAGLADACPKCLPAAPEAPPTLGVVPGPGPDLEPGPDPDEEVVGGPVDLNDERLWEGTSGSPSPQLDESPDVGKDG